MACGVPPVSAPIAGVDALVRGLDGPFIAEESSAEAIAARAIPILEARHESLRRAVAEHSKQFGYAAAAERLIRAYEAPLERD